MHVERDAQERPERDSCVESQCVLGCLIEITWTGFELMACNCLCSAPVLLT